MKTQPIEHAQIAFRDPGEPPQAPAFGDIYHPRMGALAQARHVFLRGNGLPQRWAGRSDFTVLETGFGLGHNFLATWRAWRQDPHRCDRLHVVSLELHPPRPEDLARALAATAEAEDTALAELAALLLAAWPPPTANLHRLAFEGGRVVLTLALGDAGQWLPALRLAADAVYLDGFAPARNAAMWSLPLIKAVGRACAPGATAATWSVARELHENLRTAGFEVQRASGLGGKREITLATFAPRGAPRGLPQARVASADAVVVGAGLAGAAAARALARQGLRVTVLEAAPDLAQGASGNPAGLFHGTLDTDDSPYARLFRTAALWAAQTYREALAQGVPGQVSGLLRLAADSAATPLPQGYVQHLTRAQASALAGVPLPSACWFYPGGGWVSPAAWVRHALHEAGAQVRLGAAVTHLRREGSAWMLLDATGGVQAHSALVVLAAAEQSAALLAPLGHAPWPLRRTRGQVTHWSTCAEPSLRLPVAGAGYAIPLPGALLCGATRQGGDDDPTVREADHRYNLQRLQELTGMTGPADLAQWQGRTQWRLGTDDRLPIAGPVPHAAAQAGTQARLLPREQGLFVLTALGARGLTLAPLLAELVAAQATGSPWPLEQDLADAVDPGRWQVRAARHGGTPGGAEQAQAG